MTYKGILLCIKCKYIAIVYIVVKNYYYKLYMLYNSVYMFDIQLYITMYKVQIYRYCIYCCYELLL